MKLELKTDEVVVEAKKELESLENGSRLVVNSQPTLNKAKDQLAIVKTVKKNVADKKDSVIKPLNEALKNFREIFRPIDEGVDRVERYLKSQVVDYSEKLRKIALEKEREAMEKVEKGEAKIEDAIKPVERVQERQAEIKGIKTLTRLKIVDELKIPREYLKVDEPRVFQALKAGVKIEGAELEEYKSLAN